MPQGTILKALSGFYYVLPEGENAVGATLIQCRARGVFKNRGVSPLVGDRVEFEVEATGEGTVTSIEPRTSELIRPPIANTKQAVLVFSVTEPVLNPLLLDKFLVHIEKEGLSAVICLTKQDLLQEGSKEQQEVTHVIDLYRQIGYKVIVTSAKMKQGMAEIEDQLAHNVSVFAGQSGVGKSSLLNALISDLQLETNEISHRLGRGKHTTRHVELIALQDGGFVADTPGFSQLDFMELEPEQLGDCFIEFAALAENCKFRGCQHMKEPGCKVREAVEEGVMAQSRYDSYAQFYQEMKDRKRRY
ncbi:ribosome small subunit-dependent GTPase A [Paenibacillus sp. N1-5-1-14]|uniref:ribosome small subunit-dependent GTPase A n=1 Tax=Paenibacillus radicibacter TaxID=2972488 RepID=UPI00215948FA|nr:ribosome small subunit-dependent GTPase A [Paenibacillus radicibacter]MCR8641707.1 ribosome small subunit-dependent GTPase A [Paenibacillus radicibacter]